MLQRSRFANSEEEEAAIVVLPGSKRALVLTCLGESFAGRVAASLLLAVGLPELVVRNLADYEAMARRLVAESDALPGIRARLEEGRRTARLFDTPRLCRNIEAAYLAMWEMHRRGEAPRGFVVSDVAGGGA